MYIFAHLFKSNTQPHLIKWIIITLGDNETLKEVTGN